MEATLTTDQIVAIVCRTIEKELRKQVVPKPLAATWANESEVLQLCGKTRTTLYRAIKNNLINPKDIRPNPIGKGYLFRRSALVKD